MNFIVGPLTKANTKAPERLITEPNTLASPGNIRIDMLSVLKYSKLVLQLVKEILNIYYLFHIFEEYLKQTAMIKVRTGMVLVVAAANVAVVYLIATEQRFKLKESLNEVVLKSELWVDIG